MARKRRAVPSLALLFAMALAATGCKAPGHHAAPRSTVGPRELAKQAEPLSPGEAESASSGVAPSASATAGHATAATTTPGQSRPGVTTTTARGGTGSTKAAPFSTIGSVDDPNGDAGLLAPSYADVKRVTVQDNGTRVRVTVQMAAAFPTPLSSDEVMGIGVDLFKTAKRESDYQLFADGEPDGWYAFLQTPTGFVQYPGTFEVGGDLLVFTVDWKALGDIRGTLFSAFADWSKKSAVAAVNSSSSDKAPSAGHSPFARRP